jgi:hypothetical protein
MMLLPSSFAKDLKLPKPFSRDDELEHFDAHLVGFQGEAALIQREDQETLERVDLSKNEYASRALLSDEITQQIAEGGSVPLLIARVLPEKWSPESGDVWVVNQ